VPHLTQIAASKGQLFRSSSHTTRAPAISVMFKRGTAVEPTGAEFRPPPFAPVEPCADGFPELLICTTQPELSKLSGVSTDGVSVEKFELPDCAAADAEKLIGIVMC